MEPISAPEIINISKNTKKGSQKKEAKQIPNGTSKNKFECRPLLLVQHALHPAGAADD